MSRGRGRVQRTIMEAVNETRYGCTIRSLAYRVYGGGREQGPTEAQLEVVRRVVGYIDEETLDGYAELAQNPLVIH